MAKILVNYVYNKEKDEFIIQRDAPYVFADMKVAILETEASIKIPLVVPIQGAMTVVDKTSYEQVNKKFCLIADDKGNVLEDPRGTEIWLPKNTDLSKLKVVDGRLVLVEPEVENKEEKPNKAKKKEG